MTRKVEKAVRHMFWGLFLATVFVAGWQAGKERSFQRGFETGYDAAANHISSRLRQGMKELDPFYIADIGFRFSPRGYTITNIRFIGDEAVHSARAEVTK